MSKSSPRYILSGAPVAPGVSGGVTTVGLLGSVAGALALGTVAGLVRRGPWLAATTSLAGIVGSVVDSVLGETLQAKRQVPGDQELTELDRVDGVATTVVGGVARIDNDVVNAACTLTGGLVSVLLNELAIRDRR